MWSKHTVGARKLKSADTAMWLEALPPGQVDLSLAPRLWGQSPGHPSPHPSPLPQQGFLSHGQSGTAQRLWNGLHPGMGVSFEELIPTTSLQGKGVGWGAEGQDPSEGRQREEGRAVFTPA